MKIEREGLFTGTTFAAFALLFILLAALFCVAQVAKRQATDFFPKAEWLPFLDIELFDLVHAEQR
jgi:hypothetical protein